MTAAHCVAVFVVVPFMLPILPELSQWVKRKIPLYIGALPWNIGAMKGTKRITVQLTVPSDYKWIATMPFGEVVAFKRKPKIFKGKEPPDDLDGADVEYWDKQKDELSIFSSGTDCAEWKKTLRRI